MTSDKKFGLSLLKSSINLLAMLSIKAAPMGIVEIRGRENATLRQPMLTG